MEDKTITKFKLRKLLKELESYHARHTELITQYVPSGYNVQNIINTISEELGTARNIKSASTRKNVTAALEKMIQHLRLFKRTPPNGLVIFSGNIAEREGHQDIQVWSIEPPEPLNLKVYKCDQSFYLEPLIEYTLPKTAYGLLVLDRREANIAILKGKTIVPIKSLRSAVPGKFRAGGQSAARFSRVIENLAKDFFKKIGDHANKIFQEHDVKGIIVGGPGPTKEDFVNGHFLSTALKNKIIGTKHIGYTGDFGLNELVEKSEDILAEEEIIKEKSAMNKFFTLLNTTPEKVAYGQQEVEKALKIGAVETLLISEEIDVKLAEELMFKGQESGSDTILISKETREGNQLASMGGLAATLRFSI
jgi:peptide chain release factor subunit 1